MTNPRKPTDTVITWLLDSDPAIRWQVMRDLTREPADRIAAERAKVATEGWGAALLAAQAENGTWPGHKRIPEYPTQRTLLLLHDMGLDPASEQAKRAIDRVRANVQWLMNISKEELPKDQDISWWHKPFFQGEVEPCINGRVLTIGAYFGEDMSPLVDRLLGEQMADGGWNCEQETGSTRGSFHTTIDVLEGLLEYEKAKGGAAAVATARRKGEEYLLARHLFRSLSTGKPIEFDRKTELPAIWTQFAYPAGWRYDILRGLGYLRAAGVAPDPRMDEAVQIVSSKADASGRWPLGIVHPDEVIAEPGVTEGQPSRWITLHALRVLDWFST
ncbi:MAG: hypothetical protein WD751_04210 [Anaerolineales bacterium]